MKKLISLIMTVVMACSVFVAFDVTASAASQSITLKSVTNTAKAITVKWSKTSGATKYIVQKKASNQKNYKNIKTVGSSKCSYSDKAVKAGKSYSYKVVAVKGTSQYVSKAKAVTRLLAPKSLTIKADTNYGGVIIKWKKAKGAKKYTVYRKTTGKYKKIDTADANGYYDYSAKSGAVNYYKVVAVNGSSKSVYSKAVKITYIESTYIEGFATKDGVKLEWMKSKGAQGYKIYKTTGLKSYTLLKTLSSKYTSYVDKDVKEGTTYKYYIVAYKGSVVSAKATTSVKYEPMLTIDVKVGESNTKFKDFLDTNREIMGEAAELFDYITFTYEPVNPEIATIDKEGTVTGVSVGTTKIAVFTSIKIPGLGSESEEMGYFLVNVTE
ncbi:MAG: Ig-like domain-containing protein [Oscillospiraceae bacterium]|nr:Ig-like domain-containing protein [Oscillospiraceae bacterium]